MRRRAALLACALVGLSGCSAASHYVSRQYYPARPTYVIFFSSWSSALDQKGLQAVESAASAAIKDPAATVQVVGYASTIGMDDANRQLSEARAETVRNQIIADGVDESRVTSMSRGATSYQFSPEEARRVEIAIVHAGF